MLQKPSLRIADSQGWVSSALANLGPKVWQLMTKNSMLLDSWKRDRQVKPAHPFTLAKPSEPTQPTVASYLATKFPLEKFSPQKSRPRA